MDKPDGKMTEDERELRESLEEFVATRRELADAAQRALDARTDADEAILRAIRMSDDEQEAIARVRRDDAEDLHATLNDVVQKFDDSIDRYRQHVALLSAERLTAESTSAVRATMWASWAMVLVAVATMVVAVTR